MVPDSQHSGLKFQFPPRWQADEGEFEPDPREVYAAVSAGNLKCALLGCDKPVWLLWVQLLRLLIAGFRRP